MCVPFAVTSKMASSSNTIGFPFALKADLLSIYTDSNLGQAYNEKMGTISTPYFSFPEGTAESPLIGSTKVPVLSEEYEIVETLEEATEFMQIDGSLSVHYGLMEGDGSWVFKKDNQSLALSFSVMQRCTYTVSTTEIDLGKLADVMKDKATYHKHLNEVLDDPDEVTDYIGEHGTKFVSGVVQGGACYRKITFSFQESRDMESMKAHLDGKIKTGTFDFNFSVDLEKETGLKKESTEICVTTLAAGGDPKLLKFTKDMTEALQQLDDWKKSVEEKPVVVAAHLTDIGRSLFKFCLSQSLDL
jgi:hypothetical protein